MKYLLFYRFHNTQKDKPEYYVKRKGAAGIKGHAFEYKFCALSYLRARKKWCDFKLASNVAGIGAFDDVHIQYTNSTSKRCHIFVQLKSTTAERITINKLTGNNKHFGLQIYYDSYIENEKKFNNDESLFIIYTNADVGRDLKPNKNIVIGEEEFLMTGGSVLMFNEKVHKTIYDHMHRLPRHREFLKRFRIFYGQAEEDMDDYIKDELKQLMKLPENQLDFACTIFRDIIRDWWQKSNYFLKENSCIDNDPLRKTVEKVITIFADKILDQRKLELDSLRIEYKQSAITNLKQLLESHKAFLISAPGRSTKLTAAKVHQMLDKTKHIILNLQQLVHYKSAVVLSWEYLVEVLVLEGESSAEISKELFSEMSIILHKTGAERKFIFISNTTFKEKQLSAFQDIFGKNFTGKDNWKFGDMTWKSMEYILGKKVTFHGKQIQINEIVKESHARMLNVVDYDSVSLLSNNEQLAIAIPVENSVENFYIDRQLECVTNEHQSFERQSTMPCSPSTLLDCNDRIMYVIGEPGMGKSTLLTHLAKQTRTHHSDVWIVRVNINNYTSMLYTMRTKGFEKEDALKLLNEAAQIKETESAHFEKQLFNYIYNYTGNMIVLIDGVDEVIPDHSEIFMKILKTLHEGKIKKIWVTSRISMKLPLEQEFKCPSYPLIPFIDKDQKNFVFKFLYQKYPDKKRDDLENLADRLVELSIKCLPTEHKYFMGLPQQAMLLAEMFEEDLRKKGLPQNINLLNLCDRYLNMKWNIISQRNLSDQTIVNVRTGNNKLHRIFIDNHTAVALMAILSKTHLAELNDKEVMKRGSDFLHEIDEDLEKTGIITDINEGRPIFQNHIVPLYLVATYLCDNIHTSQTFMKDHIFESEFDEVRSMVDRILAGKYPIHEAVLNSNKQQVAKLLKMEKSVTQTDSEGRTPLHVAVSCRSPELVRLLLEHGADLSSVDKLLGLSPVEYAIRLANREILSLLMEKKPDIREKVLHELNLG